MAGSKAIIPRGRIERAILIIRGQKVMLDADLAELYGVTTKRLNEQVKRNRNRFPKDFIFRLSSKGKAEVVANCDHLKRLKFSPTLPYAFTEHGTVMLASVLNSRRAIEVSIHVVRVFVRIREMLSTHKEVSRKLSELEKKVEGHDEHIRALFQAIRQLMAPQDKKQRRIGFIVSEKAARYARRSQRTISGSR